MHPKVVVNSPLSALCDCLRKQGGGVCQMSMLVYTEGGGGQKSVWRAHQNRRAGKGSRGVRVPSASFSSGHKMIKFLNSRMKNTAFIFCDRKILSTHLQCFFLRIFLKYIHMQVHTSSTIQLIRTYEFHHSINSVYHLNLLKSMAFFNRKF